MFAYPTADQIGAGSRNGVMTSFMLHLKYLIRLHENPSNCFPEMTKQVLLKMRWDQLTRSVLSKATRSAKQVQEKYSTPSAFFFYNTKLWWLFSTADFSCTLQFDDSHCSSWYFTFFEVPSGQMSTNNIAPRVPASIFEWKDLYF